MSEALSLFIAEVNSAQSNASLYSPEHAEVYRHTANAARHIEGLFPEEGPLSFTLLADTLICNNERVTAKGIHITAFIERLRKKGVEKIIIRRGVEAGELRHFIIFLSSNDPTPPVLRDISFGIIEVGLGTGAGKGGDGSGEGEARRMLRESVPKVQDLHARISRFKEIDTAALDDVIGQLMAAVKKEVNVFQAVVPFKFHSEYTYAHIVNVAVVSIYIAESLGIKGDVLHDIGVAALLHDVGKMFVSNKIIDKEGKLDADEWTQMQMHTVLGARYLAGMPEIPKLAVLTSFEHHLKFDGSGYPATRFRSRKQHIVSQMVAIADVFDALRAERSYRKPMPIEKVIKMLVELKGKDFNPFLVDHFIAHIQGGAGAYAPFSRTGL